MGPAFDNIRLVRAPDSYRPHTDDEAQAFADEVQQGIKDLENAGHGFSALLLCPIFANEGFPAQEPGWLKPVAEVVRKAGGLLIADEIQPGFGRIGSHMWGYQRAGIIPDIVTLGKPMGNGHPIGATITSSALMKEFRSSSKYFNTFGGNPVSCAAALATLNVLRDENLMQNAADVGAYAQAGLRKLAETYEVIGDVRGLSFFFGAEMVLDRKTKKPAATYVKKLVNGLRQRGILLNFIGIHYNVLKMRPPMPFSRANADMMLGALEDVLRTTPVDA